MRQAGKIAATALAIAGKALTPGVTTQKVNQIIHDYIIGRDAKPAFLGYGGFPASACISINSQVIHGIPGDYALRDGDIVKIDVGSIYKGFHGDCANTFLVGKVSESAQKLAEVTRQSFYEGIKCAKPGFRVGDISHAVQQYVEAHGYSIVRNFVGHGLGLKLHEEPEVPNYGTPGRGPRLEAGMTLAIEPMVNQGGYQVFVAEDEWTVFTKDNSLSAHFENSVLITDDEPEILTIAEEQTGGV